MRKLEPILLAAVGVALAMKVLHLPLSSFLLIVGLSTLCTVYLLYGRIIFPTPGPGDQIPALSVAASVALGVALIGILFKVQVWPLSGIYLLAGILSLAALAVAFAFKRPSRPDLGPYITNMLRRMVPVLVIAMVLYVLPDRALLEYYYRDQPGKAELLERLHRAPDRATEERLIHQLDSLERWVWKKGPTERAPRHSR